MSKIIFTQTVLIPQELNENHEGKNKFHGLVAGIKADKRPKPRCDIYVQTKTTVTAGSETKCYSIGGCETSHFLNFNTKVTADILPIDAIGKIDSNALVQLNFDEATRFGIKGKKLKSTPQSKGATHLEYNITEKQGDGDRAPARETNGLFYENTLFGGSYLNKLVPYIHGSCDIGGLEIDTNSYILKPTPTK